MAELQALNDYLAPLLTKLSDAERRKLEMSIARKVRASQKTRITRQQNPDGSAFVPRKKRLRDKKNKIKNKMFNLIKTSKYMKIERTSEGVAIGFMNRVANIARVHQYGLRDRVEKGGPTVKYDSRELLGFTPAELEMIESEVLDHFSK
ncbi:phage virion morphogenesis protein [Acinetobacter johnsonii]|uniref:phage virion morphogenesis protein n=1 Tax=Acinetobacter johnsonii TaxID=40214 RepID=UPI00244832D0|nr:phage virion morphogenesis protein [Acinetobacter johnsonii]MDH0834032.1 phage virion morphogenesis protein [Acinetobacter johnsonii]MDH0837299.1 phage virion morphogenesis protein [Acinetobacter johnsonii]